MIGSCKFFSSYGFKTEFLDFGLEVYIVFTIENCSIFKNNFVSYDELWKLSL